MRLAIMAIVLLLVYGFQLSDNIPVGISISYYLNMIFGALLDIVDASRKLNKNKGDKNGTIH